MLPPNLCVLKFSLSLSHTYTNTHAGTHTQSEHVNNSLAGSDHPRETSAKPKSSSWETSAAETGNLAHVRTTGTTRAK